MVNSETAVLPDSLDHRMELAILWGLGWGVAVQGTPEKGF